MTVNFSPDGNRRTSRGFTLVELLITVAVLALVAVVLSAVLMGTSRSKRTTTSLIESSQSARAALEMLARDIRTAGYGVDLSNPGGAQPAIAYVDSAEIIIATNLYPYPDTSSIGVPNAPLAYNPSSSPNPRPLVASTYTPPGRYRTGAELVRYTLDVNNDGAVDASDVSSAAGADAMATPNPDDYMLVRQVYGDSTGNTAGNNGGSSERIALVRKPGGDVPPIFTVYMRGSSTPWDWSSGAVPASQLGDIERVEVRVTATSGRPDARGGYPVTTMQAQVNSLRNTPNFGAPTYVVDGYVFDDLNENGVKDTGEPGLAGSAVRAGGTYVAYTASTGYYQLRLPQGSHVMRHTPIAGYGNFRNPDSVTVSIPPGTSVSFPDTARSGGNITVHVWRDEDGDGIEDAGEAGLAGRALTLTPGTGTAYTDASGNATVFASTGGYSLAVTVPDSMVATTTNPVSGTMTDGGSASHSFGLQPSLTGRIAGKAYRDNNRNGVYDTGEPGLQNVWVGVTKTGVDVAGYAYTDASGNYSITVPINDPPHTQQYFVYAIPLAGYFPTSPIAIGNVWVQNAATVTGKNFGMVGYQIITLNASRVLSLATVDLIEKDWNGNQTQNARKDRDLVLGADAGSTDNISVWFNQYNSTPLFNANADYSRLAPQSVLAIAVDTLDTSDPIARPDVVTGTRKAAAGNFFVWLNQNSSGNLGYLPTSYSTGLNYTTLDAGDVQAVKTVDMGGNAMPDIIVGTKSPTIGRGTLEVWLSSGGAAPTYTRDEVYPNAGNIPGNAMGEVNAMVMADFDGDGDRDLAVGTKTGTYSGEILMFEMETRTTGSRFRCRHVETLYGDAVTALAVADPNGDGRPDLMVGTQYAPNRGHLQHWHNDGSWSFTQLREIEASGIVMTLSTADLGGGLTTDLVVGWRQNETSYGGGVEVYYLDLGILPAVGVDPSGGSVVNMAPATVTGDFDWGATPTKSPPYLMDIAAGIKASPTTGALVVFIR